MKKIESDITSETEFATKLIQLVEYTIADYEKSYLIYKRMKDNLIHSAKFIETTNTILAEIGKKPVEFKKLITFKSEIEPENK